MVDRTREASVDRRPDVLRDQSGIAVDDLQRLWAPWRTAYITRGDAIDGCPFCVLPARGTSADRASLVLHRGEHAYVILNAYPYNPGHAMVVPFEHIADVGDLDHTSSDEFWQLTRLTVTVVREQLGASGINVGMNLGAVSGAGIADHLHQHVVPRWPGDTNFMSVVGASRVLPSALDDVYTSLVDGFRRA
ncbi:MAG: HIT domain-containing protein [Nitriliruptoraceae bacterium]